MKKVRNTLKSLIIIACVIWLCAALVTTAGAALSLIQVEQEDGRPVIAGVEEGYAVEKDRSRAPEPSTLALFGSGIFGMIMSFIRKTYERVKRVFDIVIALTAFVLLSPLCLLAALLIKLTSKGPILFKQTRVGKDGKLFDIYKFRTMRTDAEKETGPVWAAQNDNRLIPVGKLLRKSRIDEIPQFINVLRGEMSVIGPRPERPFFVEKLSQEIPSYNKRLAIKPGITGLAQVRHKYDETIADVKKKVRYDLVYIEKICLWMDLRIMFRTVKVVLTGQGAR